MFNAWGRTVAAKRGVVLVVMVAAMILIAGAGHLFGKEFTQGGFEDPKSGYASAESIEQDAYGRDAMGDVVVLYHAPGGNVDDQGFLSDVQTSLDELQAEHPDDVIGVTSYTQNQSPQLVNRDEGFVVASVQLAGVGDEVLPHFNAIEDDLAIDGVETQVGGLQAVAGAIDDGMTNDLKRAELIALPVVFVLLVVVFGGLVAAALPVLVGVLTILGALGLLQLLGIIHPVNSFANNVVTLIGLGLAIDYGLFVVSRFREEMAAGYGAQDAARRSVATAGRTVAFSALMVGVTLSGLLLFPQEFLKSVSYGAIAAVLLAALLSVTLLPAVLAMLGHRVDMLSVRKVLARFIPKLREPTGPRKDVAPGDERGFFARVARFAMRRPVLITIPIVVVLIALIAPFSGVKFGGINETYLPPNNDTRVAQETYDAAFPESRTDPVKLVIVGADSTQLTEIRNKANEAPALTGTFQFARSGETDEQGRDVTVLQASIVDRNDADETVEYLQKFPIPDGTEVYVGGNPALEYDSIQALMDGLPWFVLYVFVATTILLFLAFGSLVLPIKAALMNLLGLGATLGILTWIFVDGHGAGMLGFTPGPLTSPVVVLLVAIIYGLSTDYEVFLLSRMVEARSRGASTNAAIRSGIARTGQIITSAALILIVVTGAFAFSEIVMMKYIAFGMIAALIIDATVIRMLLVPAVMKMLGKDCWWAPRWMKRIQERVGLSEAELEDEKHLLPAAHGAEIDGRRGAAVVAGSSAAAEYDDHAGYDEHEADDAHASDADTHEDRDGRDDHDEKSHPEAARNRAADASETDREYDGGHAETSPEVPGYPGAKDQAAAKKAGAQGGAKPPAIKRRAVARSYGPGTAGADQAEKKAEAPKGKSEADAKTAQPDATSAKPAGDAKSADPKSSHKEDRAREAAARQAAERYGRHAGRDESISAKDLIARLREERN